MNESIIVKAFCQGIIDVVKAADRSLILIDYFESEHWYNMGIRQKSVIFHAESVEIFFVSIFRFNGFSWK